MNGLAGGSTLLKLTQRLGFKIQGSYCLPESPCSARSWALRLWNKAALILPASQERHKAQRSQDLCCKSQS